MKTIYGIAKDRIIINIYSFLLLSSIISLFYYFYLNINNKVGGSIALLWMVSFFILSTQSILLRMIFDSNLYVKKSLYLMFIFFWYFLFRVMVDGQGFGFLVSRTLNTNTGMILFVITGSIASSMINKLTSDCINNKYEIKDYNFLLFLFYFCITFYTLFDLVSSLSSDKLLIDNVGNHYQRSGNFLIISFYLFSFLYVNYVVLNSRVNSVIFIFYIFIGFTSMFNAQLFGSNNGLAGVGGIMFVTILFVLLYSSRKSRSTLYLTKLNIKNLIFSKLAKYIYKYIILALTVFILSLTILMSYFDINFAMFRVSGFGSGNTSLSSRLDMWGYFIENFSYSPYFGNLMVEEVVGTYNYTHSFFAYMLTHLGLLGMLLFLFYIFAAVNEVVAVSNRESDIRVKGLIFYSLMLFAVIFVLGNITATMYWIVLWFSIGFTFSPFKLNSRLKSI